MLNKNNCMVGINYLHHQSNQLSNYIDRQLILYQTSLAFIGTELAIVIRIHKVAYFAYTLELIDYFIRHLATTCTISGKLVTSQALGVTNFTLFDRILEITIFTLALLSLQYSLLSCQATGIAIKAQGLSLVHSPIQAKTTRLVQISKILTVAGCAIILIYGTSQAVYKIYNTFAQQTAIIKIARIAITFSQRQCSKQRRITFCALITIYLAFLTQAVALSTRLTSGFIIRRHAIT
ncbi:hypothetical protein pb186bvf_021098 [Paramecium bursaria]